MIVRISIALLVALLAHAGAYAIILVGSPKKAAIHVKGGSISISLMPTDQLAPEEPDSASEESATSESDAPIESAPHPQTEPKTEREALPEPAQTPDPVEPTPQSLPEPEPEPEPETETETEPVPEDEAPAPEPQLEPQAESLLDPTATPEPLDTGPTDPASANDRMTDALSSQLDTAPPTVADTKPEAPLADGGGAPDQEAASRSDITNAELGNAAEDNYNGALMRHLRKARKFDTNARRSSKISITIDPQGHVLEVRVLRASGDKTWDRRVVKELKRIAPYPAPPSGGTHSWSFDAVPK